MRLLLVFCIKITCDIITNYVCSTISKHYCAIITNSVSNVGEGMDVVADALSTTTTGRKRKNIPIENKTKKSAVAKGRERNMI